MEQINCNQNNITEKAGDYYLPTINRQAAGLKRLCNINTTMKAKVNVQNRNTNLGRESPQM